ncbi:MAG: transposase, partial [Planctomycetota bacterium]
MRVRLRPLAWSSLVACSLAACARPAPWAAADWRPANAPQRIVAASLLATEVLLEILPRERLAGVHVLAADPRFSLVAGDVQGLPLVGADAEQLLAVRPDLVLCDAYTRPETLALLSSADVPVVVTADPASFDDIAANVQRIGRVVHREAEAAAMVLRMHERLRALAADAPAVAAWRVMNLDGGSLHANTWVAPRERERLEALCRYAARPAVSESRLAELPDGRIGYALKRRFADGTTAVVMTNAVLMERLCALVPPPRKHLVTYHGVLAPASGLRPKVVPRQTVAGEEDAAGAATGCRHGAGGGGGSQVAGADNAATTAMSAAAVGRRQHAERRARARLRVPHRSGRRRSRRQRLPWADLLRRVFGIDVLVCPQCAGPRRVLAAIHDP